MIFLNPFHCRSSCSCYDASFTKKSIVLTNPCHSLSGIGPVLAAKLAQCGIHTLGDLLFHLPYRYQDRTRITSIGDVRPKDWAVIAGTVCKAEIKLAKKRMLECYVQDKTGIIKLRFFYFNSGQVKAFQDSPLIRAFGEVREFKNQLEMIHPQYQVLKTEAEYQVEEYLTPIYPSTQGLSQTRLRQVIQFALKRLEQEKVPLEWMSQDELSKHCFLSMDSALQLLHNPPPDTSLEALEQGKHPALKRLVFDELLAQRLSLQFARKSQAAFHSPAMPLQDELSNRFLATLPFALTQAQQRVRQEISADLSQTKPMLRLLQGDVG